MHIYHLSSSYLTQLFHHQQLLPSARSLQSCSKCLTRVHSASGPFKWGLQWRQTASQPADMEVRVSSLPLPLLPHSVASQTELFPSCSTPCCGGRDLSRNSCSLFILERLQRHWLALSVKSYLKARKKRFLSGLPPNQLSSKHMYGSWEHARLFSSASRAGSSVRKLF